MLIRKVITTNDEGQQTTTWQIGSWTPGWEWDCLASFDDEAEALEYYGRMVGHIE